MTSEAVFIQVGALADGFAPHGNLLATASLPAGENFTFYVAGSEPQQLVIEDEQTLSWNGKRAPWRATALRPDILFIDFLDPERDNASISAVCNLTQRNATLVYGQLPDEAAARLDAFSRVEQGLPLTAVEARFVFARLDAQPGPLPGFTTALVGMRNQYTYSPTERYEHIYLNDNFYAWQCLDGVEKGADYQKLSEQLPVVLFDRSPSDSALPLVMTDSVTPTAELISRIAPQHADEFWFLGGQPRLSPSRDRLAGFTQGLAQAGITLRPEWVINGNYHPSSGYEMFAALCARLGRPPKALFTAACGLLEGVLRYMSQHHLLDSNIHLASFDDHYLYDSLSLRIDTVQQDNRQLAWHCYDLLSQLIDGQAPEPLQRYLPATLQIRHP